VALDSTQSRVRGRAGTTTWPVGNAPAAPGLAGPRFGFFTAAKLRQWVAEEVATAHLLPWLAVAYGFGVVLYFTADHEPAWWAGTALAAVSAGFAVMLRRHLVAFVIALVVASMAAGFRAIVRRKEQPVLERLLAFQSIIDALEVLAADKARFLAQLRKSER
jgi:hypothetical protein